MAAAVPDDNNKVEYVTSNFRLHKFSAEISERTILYQVLKMKDSLLIFINGRDNLQLNNLYVSMISRFDNLPVGTKLLGNFIEEEVSKGIASRISKRLSKTVYVSCNLEDDRSFLPLVEKRVYEEIKKNPEVF